MAAAQREGGGELDGLYPAQPWARALALAVDWTPVLGLVLLVSLTAAAPEGRIEDERGLVYDLVAVVLWVALLGAAPGYWLASWRWLDRRTPRQRLFGLRTLRTDGRRPG